MRLIDLRNKKFGRLTVIERVESSNKNARWSCLCECGKLVSVFGADLKSGRTQSCGCIRSEQLAKRNFKHGLSDTRIMNIWRGMKDRCNNPNNKAYKIYGAEGKTVCEEWQEFQAFYDWSMANGYRDDLTIERINSAKGYSPDNCKWANREEQANNMRTNRLIPYGEETHTIAEWAKIKGLSYTALKQRLYRKWPIEKALNTPT